MSAYQTSRYEHMLRRIPELLALAQLAALASQSAAMILTKLGQGDLAWVASQRGLAAAERSEDPAILGSLLRSVIHSLLSDGRVNDARDMTRRAADYLHSILDTAQPRIVSVYGSLLLPGAVAAARSNDRSTAVEYLSEAGDMARSHSTSFRASTLVAALAQRMKLI